MAKNRFKGKEKMVLDMNIRGYFYEAKFKGFDQNVAIVVSVPDMTNNKPLRDFEKFIKKSKQAPELEYIYDLHDGITEFKDSSNN